MRRADSWRLGCLRCCEPLVFREFEHAKSGLAGAACTRAFTRNTAKNTQCTQRPHVSGQHAKTRGHNAVCNLVRTRVFRVQTGLLRVFHGVFHAVHSVFDAPVKQRGKVPHQCCKSAARCGTSENTPRPRPDAVSACLSRCFSAALASRAHASGVRQTAANAAVR